MALQRPQIGAPRHTLLPHCQQNSLPASAQAARQETPLELPPSFVLCFPRVSGNMWFTLQPSRPAGHALQPVEQEVAAMPGCAVPGKRQKIEPFNTRDACSSSLWLRGGTAVRPHYGHWLHLIHTCCAVTCVLGATGSGG